MKEHQIKALLSILYLTIKMIFYLVHSRDTQIENLLIVHRNQIVFPTHDMARNVVRSDLFLANLDSLAFVQSD